MVQVIFGLKELLIWDLSVFCSFEISVSVNDVERWLWLSCIFITDDKFFYIKSILFEYNFMMKVEIFKIICWNLFFRAIGVKWQVTVGRCLKMYRAELSIWNANRRWEKVWERERKRNVYTRKRLEKSIKDGLWYFIIYIIYYE